MYARHCTDDYFLLSPHVWVESVVCAVQTLFAPAMAMYRCYREGTIYMRLFEVENRSWTSPYIYTMAVLIVSIKVLYGLDGLPRPTPLGLPAAPTWLQWAESVLERLQGPLHPAPFEQVPDLLY